MKNIKPIETIEEFEDSDKSTKMVRVQELVGSTTLNLIEAYRKKAGLSSRAHAARALITQGLLQQRAQVE